MEQNNGFSGSLNQSCADHITLLLYSPLSNWALHIATQSFFSSCLLQEIQRLINTASLYFDEMYARQQLINYKNFSQFVHMLTNLHEVSIQALKADNLVTMYYIMFNHSQPLLFLFFQYIEIIINGICYDNIYRNSSQIVIHYWYSSKEVSRILFVTNSNDLIYQLDVKSEVK